MNRDGHAAQGPRGLEAGAWEYVNSRSRVGGGWGGESRYLLPVAAADMGDAQCWVLYREKKLQTEDIWPQESPLVNLTWTRIVDHYVA